MKTMKMNSLLILAFVFMFSCSNSTTQTFEATFTGEYVNIVTGDELTDCPEGYECLVVVAFKGTATQLGNIGGQFSFCACGPEGKYAPTDSYMVASAGDTLFFSCQGRVIQGRLDEHPEFVTSYWRDPFVFKGGTGRFEGATGGGTTDDYNSSEDPNSHHHWVGTITLK